MREVFKISCFLLLIFGVGVKGNAQTYTFDLTRPNCNGTWTDADCWEKLNNINIPAGCSDVGTSVIPNLSGGTGTCQRLVVITGNVTYNGTMSLRGPLNEIRVQNGAVFTIPGDISILANQTINFNLIENSELNINGSLGFESASGGPSAATRLTVKGDSSSYLRISQLDLRNRGILTVEAGANVINEGPSNYNGNGSRIDVYGFYRTAAVDIQGGPNHQLNSYGNADIIVDGDVTIAGNSNISFNGNSEIDVGGNINAAGSTSITVSDNAKVYHCGTREGNTFQVGGGLFIPQCRILPVDYTHFEVVQSPNRASTLLKWTTAKEENNEYFEVERSLAGIQHFKVIGQVPGMGWTDASSAYVFEDNSLPLAGGDVYYRLRQVDFDGKYSLSKVLKLRVQGVNSTRGIWRVHPNPVAGESPKLSLVEASAYTDGPIQIRLIHVSSVMQKAELQSIDQLNESFPSLFAKMPNGLILLEISWGTQVEQIKIMKK
ncbi:Hypothetical protein C943_03109 [Mariniradius saccharolyticus AK6]|uniref:Uncharacterized protein n=1 Tax=Mariniradius saccharolyticus AK6 TaxID=1239962 RepID=M7Y0Z5_9BACT|nr:Hypothetical protein C943_03109 [Mariniradius saccharolyticus AK6]